VAEGPGSRFTTDRVHCVPTHVITTNKAAAMAGLVADVELEKADGSKVAGASLKDCALVAYYFSAHWCAARAHACVLKCSLLVVPQDRRLALALLCQVSAVSSVYTDPEGPVQ